MAVVENHLIALLPRVDRLRLLALCEPVQLVLSEVLCEAGAQVRHAYFPVDGFISLVTRVDNHPGVEVGMIGREGMLGVQLALGVAVAPLHALVQGPGMAWRIGAVALRRELARSTALQRNVNRYLYVLMTQLTISAACVRFHQIGPRLARWLMMSEDRAHTNRFRVTHEFLAYMLGVRRVSITAAAGGLQRSGLIEYRRGDLTVLDRKGLAAVACSCYAADQRAYAEQWPRSRHDRMSAPRTESDSFGTIEVPADALWGAQAVEENRQRQTEERPAIGSGSGFQGSATSGRHQI